MHSDELLVAVSTGTAQAAFEPLNFPECKDQ